MKIRNRILAAFAGAALAGAALAPAVAPAEPAEAITGTTWRVHQCAAGYEPAIKIDNRFNPRSTGVDAYTMSEGYLGSVTVRAGILSGWIKISSSYSAQQFRIYSNGSYNFYLTCLA